MSTSFVRRSREVAAALQSGDIPTPKQVLSYLATFLVGPLRDVYCDPATAPQVLYPLVPNATPATIESWLSATCGLFCGAVPVVSMSRFEFCKNPKPVIGVHWPTLLSNITILHDRNPALALFVLSFKDVFAAHSPYVADLMSRFYAAQSQRHMSQGITSPLAAYLAVEERALAMACTELAMDTSTAATVFRKTLVEECALRYRCQTRNMHRAKLSWWFRANGLGDESYKHPLRLDPCSLLDFNQSFQGPFVSGVERHIQFPGSLPKDTPAADNTYRENQKQVFSCAVIPDALHEIWLAYDAARYLAPKFALDKAGVFIHNGVIFIHWGRWFMYRNGIHRASFLLRFLKEPREVVSGFIGRKGTVCRLRDVLEIKRRKTKSNSTSSEFPPFSLNSLVNLAPLYRATYKTLFLPSVPWDSVAPDAVKTAWGATQNVEEELSFHHEHISLVSIKALRNLSLRLLQGCITRQIGNITDDTSTRQRLPRPQYDRFPVQHMLAISGYTITVVRDPKRTLFIPSWSMSSVFRGLSLQPHNIPSEKAELFGIYPVASEASLGFTYSFMERYAHYPLGLSAEVVIPKLQRFSRLSYEKFRDVYAPSSKLALHPLAEKAARTWTFAEDTAIKVMYRPNMSKEDQERLMHICNGRKASAISRRARDLRRVMIKKGVFDLKQLPHRNYNAKIQREIDYEKRRRAQKKF